MGGLLVVARSEAFSEFLHQWCVIVRGMLELGMLPSHPAGITKRRFLNSPKHVGVEKNAFKKGLL